VDKQPDYQANNHMSVCKNIKGYARRHEWMADLFSLLAILLLFSSLYLGAAYYHPLLSWIKGDALLHLPATTLLLLLDLFLILLFLNIGSARFGEENEGCFHTFRGRRTGSGSVGLMINSWLHHIEQVGRKHR
jgi:phosphoglycerol transferase MdoB-like AlkP superfamily enzyme